MKIKKLKKLMKAINDLAKRPIEDIKGVKLTKMELAPGHPLVLLPNRGKYCLPEVTIINKIIKSIEPKEIIVEAMKANIQSGILLISTYVDKQFPRLIMTLVHTPFGCIGYRMELNEDPIFPSDKINPENIRVDENLRDKFEML